MKKIETSKKILLASWVAAIALTITAINGVHEGLEHVSEITTIAGFAWAELTAAHSFYYWKSKNENRAKGSQKLIKDLASKYGIDSAAKFAEIIYKD